MHARLEALEARPALGVERDDLAVEDHAPRAQLARERAHLRIARREVGEVAALQRDVAVVEEGDRADAVPLDLEAPVLLVAGQLAGPGQHRREALGHRLVAGSRRRVHAVDQPVLAARGEQRVAALQPLAVERRDHLVVAELLGLVGAAVPDLHRPGAVLALGDLALEVEVLERVVLGVHGEPVLVGVLRDPARQRPRDQHAVVLQPQVPVQVAGVVLLDHEAALPAAAGAAGAARRSSRSHAWRGRSRVAWPSPSGVSPTRSRSSSIDWNTISGAGLAQLGLGEAAGEHRDRLDSRPARRLAVPGRVADHDRLAAACLLHRGLHEIGLRLGRLHVARVGPGVDQLAGVEQVEVVIDLVRLGRAGQHDRVAAVLELLDQLARAVEGLDLADQLAVALLLDRADVLALLAPPPPRRRAPRPGGRRPSRCAGGSATRATARRAPGRPGTTPGRAGSWCRRACRRCRGSPREACSPFSLVHASITGGLTAPAAALGAT